MKYFLALTLSVLSFKLFAQHEAPQPGQQQVQDPQTKKQVQVAQQNQQAPQVAVFRYDTVLTHDPQHHNDVDMKIYSNTGRLVKAGRVLNGKKEGVWRSYYDNGMLSRIEEYHEDVINGLVVAVEVNGTVTEEDNIVNGKKEGVSHQYNRNGTIKLEENYSNGLLNGWRRTFSGDGKMQEEGFWRNSQRDSINRWAYPSGKIYVEYNYKNGNISGPAKLYYESGNVKAEGNYVEGYEEGVWKEYSDSTKKVTAQGSYKAGKKTGTWKTFKADGTPGKPQQYDANGNLVNETPMTNPKQKSK